LALPAYVGLFGYESLARMRTFRPNLALADNPFFDIGSDWTITIP
jgi:hypothetical protein